MIYNNVDVNILRIIIRQGWVNINEVRNFDAYENDSLWLLKWSAMGVTSVNICPAAYAKAMGHMKIYELLIKEGAIETDTELFVDDDLDYELDSYPQD